MNAIKLQSPLEEKNKVNNKVNLPQLLTAFL